MLAFSTFTEILKTSVYPTPFLSLPNSQRVKIMNKFYSSMKSNKSTLRKLNKKSIVYINVQKSDATELKTATTLTEKFTASFDQKILKAL